MESPSRTPPARSSEHAVTLTLIERRATFWLFTSGSLAFCAAWISESWLNVMATTDRIAYPAMAILLLLLALRTDQPLNLYGLGSAAPWIVGMQLLIFATWPLRQALGLSL